MPRFLELIITALVALVLLMPRPSVDAKPALEADAIELDRVAVQQDELFHHPDSIDAALQLADSFLSFMRSDWAIATLAPYRSRGDYRVHLTLATAHAERLEAQQAFEECETIAKLCAKPDSCPNGALAKSDLLRNAMKNLVDGQIDPAKDPVRAREVVYKALHPLQPGFKLKTNR